MLPFCMALVWFTSTTMHFTGKLTYTRCVCVCVYDKMKYFNVNINLMSSVFMFLGF